MTYIRKIRDAGSYRDRLNRFLSDSLLRFNPYQISDERLLAGVEKMRWRGAFSLTQMVILNFRDIQSSGPEGYMREKVIYTLGDSDEEITEYIGAFIGRKDAADSLQPVRNTINDRAITQLKHMYPLIGKRVFVSRNIITVTHRWGFGKAMRMHRLKGKPAEDAAMIRETAVSAKIEMLGRLLAYPRANVYLDGEPSMPVDIATPIRAVMAEISAFPTVVGKL